MTERKRAALDVSSFLPKEPLPAVSTIQTAAMQQIALEAGFTHRVATASPPAARQQKSSKQIKATFEFPAELHKAIRRRAVEEGTSARAILLLALQRDGFVVDDDEVHDRRRTP